MILQVDCFINDKLEMQICQPGQTYLLTIPVAVNVTQDQIAGKTASIIWGGSVQGFLTLEGSIICAIIPTNPNDQVACQNLKVIASYLNGKI